MTFARLNRWYPQSLLAALLLFGAVPAQAAETCSDNETVGACWDRIRQTVVSEAAEGVATEEKTDLEKKPTGEDTSGTTLQSTTKSFLPLLALSGLLGKGGVVENQGDIIVDLNFLLPGGLGGKNSQLQAVAKTEPVLVGAVREALPEVSRAELSGQLEDLISAGDDLVVSFAYNMQGLNRGRNFELYRARYQALVEPFVTALVNQQAKADTAIVEALSEVACTGATDLDEVTFDQVGKTCGPGPALAAKAQVAKAALAFYAPLGALRENLTAAGLDRFAELVANQPQLHVSVKRSERDPLVGANTTAGKLTYEWARVNLAAAMREDCHRRLESVATADPDFVEECTRQYNRYVTTHDAAIATGERFSLSLEYESIEPLVVPLSTLLPASGLTDLRFPSSKKRIAALGWSRNFAGLENEPTRLDLVARYEDVTDDPARQDRLVATATFNLKVAGMDVPLGIVYANHGEYLGEVDRQLSAHLGIKINLEGLGAKK